MTVDPIDRAIEQAVATGSGDSELAYAKINLALHVTGQRADGYHLIETLVVFADYADVVSAEPADDRRMGLSVRGPFAEPLGESTPQDDNLVLRAARELLRASGKAKAPATSLTLTKRIPIAAGLGGGSADAAAVLRLLNRYWGLGLDPATLAGIALKLGADVPMCLAAAPLIARSIGEEITAVVGLPTMPIVLAHPGVPVPTAAVFAALTKKDGAPLPPPPQRFGSLLDVLYWLRQGRNDLAEPAAEVNKAAAAGAKALISDPECLFARMSGSGAAAFGIFATMAAAARAADRLRVDKPLWWITPAMTRPSPEAMVAS